eukprot:CAMPEP_0177669930 /NCGR_PEP_ID=MMETSP0447-20121125/23777_1 /TAXON_ID=0 /ORGANISM="Stygamoeba regulata, Strain BSH-02190019" /LENGTH=129 /DNA_ID=CAMNT_0019176977 /DNA_START=12 /DNA_END=401 /DNA_ORIENTATION=+
MAIILAFSQYRGRRSSRPGSIVTLDVLSQSLLSLLKCSSQASSSGDTRETLSGALERSGFIPILLVLLTTPVLQAALGSPAPHAASASSSSEGSEHSATDTPLDPYARVSLIELLRVLVFSDPARERAE